MITVSLSPEGRDHVCPSWPILCPRCWNKWMNCHLYIKSSEIYLPLLTSFLESRSLFDSKTTFFVFLLSPPTQSVSSGMHRLPLTYSLSVVVSQIIPYLATSNNKCSVSLHVVSESQESRRGLGQCFWLWVAVKSWAGMQSAEGSAAAGRSASKPIRVAVAGSRCLLNTV